MDGVFARQEMLPSGEYRTWLVSYHAVRGVVVVTRTIVELQSTIAETQRKISWRKLRRRGRMKGGGPWSYLS